LCKRIGKLRVILAALVICFLAAAIYYLLNSVNVSDKVMGNVLSNPGSEMIPTLYVDMANRTGALKHGAAGFLYGLGEDGVPSAQLLAPLKPKITVQKAPDGMQHPNGDALSVSETFIEADGEQIQVYLQDYYALWPYEFTNLDDYIGIIKVAIPKIKSSKYSDRFVYVPFNEPDWIWYEGLDRDESIQFKFFVDWLTVYKVIKETDPAARLAGPGLAEYRPAFFERFISFCRENNCMPDIITWHELQEDKLRTFSEHYEHFRALEKSNGLDEREIAINEYAPQDHCSVPGKLVGWISVFEDKKVSACLPYWHISNNLNDLAADSNEPNGAWWLYKWYGDMSGETVRVRAEHPGKQEFYGLAAINENKKCSNVIFGGAKDQVRIVLTNLDKTQSFDSDKVKIKIEATYWTGYHGVAGEPEIILEGVYPVENGTASIDIGKTDEMAAYNITIARADKKDEVGIIRTGPWRKTYQAEKAELIGKANVKSKLNGNYAYSGKKIVESIENPGDGAGFHIDVPMDGYYRFELIYGNGSGNNTANPQENKPESVESNLIIDGEAFVRMILPNTLSRYMAGMYTDYIKLAKGEHSLVIKHLSGSEGATLDCIRLVYAGVEMPPDEKIYEAELSDFNQFSNIKSSHVKTENSIPGYSGSGYVGGLNKLSVPEGGGIRFNVMAKDNGLYSLSLVYCSEEKGNVNVYIDNTARTLNRLAKSIKAEDTGGKWKELTMTAFLKQGINAIDIDADADIAIDYLKVAPCGDVSDKVITIQAENCPSIGRVETGTSQYADGDRFVKGIPASPNKENKLLLNVDVPQAGLYKMVVHHSNAELFGRHDYNAQLVDRFATIQVNGGKAFNVFFRNTYSDDSFKSSTVDVRLAKGINTILIYNDDSRSIKCGIRRDGEIQYETLANLTPNFDKFEFYPSILEGSK